MKLKDNDEIEYNLKIKNIGFLEATINVWDTFPRGIDVYEVKLKHNEKEEVVEIKNYMQLSQISIIPQQEITINIKAKTAIFFLLI